MTPCIGYCYYGWDTDKWDYCLTTSLPMIQYHTSFEEQLKHNSHYRVCSGDCQTDTDKNNWCSTDND